MSGLDGLGWPPALDFSEMPLPWRYRDDTRDVVASNGTVVCKAGDTVADGYMAGPLIVELAHRIGIAIDRARKGESRLSDFRMTDSRELRNYMRGRVSAFNEIANKALCAKEDGR